jgi:hypothetical protein
VVDIIPDELKNDVPGRDKSNKKRVGSYMRRFLRKNLGDDLRTAKMRSEGKGVRDMLVVSEEGLSVIATYVYHKAQGFDFRSCYSALPGELAVKAPVRDWEAGNRAFA